MPTPEKIGLVFHLSTSLTWTRNYFLIRSDVALPAFQLGVEYLNSPDLCENVSSAFDVRAELLPCDVAYKFKWLGFHGIFQITEAE